MSSSRKATAIAHPNIALVKYWGKRDEHLILPHQSSLSVTLGPIAVTTTVEFGGHRDEVELNGRVAQGPERARVLGVLDSLRVGRELGPAKVVSRGDFPAAAGLASSAAGFAALAVAARAAAGLPPQVREASILARLGSGSACRSIQGGVCVWRRGQRGDGLDSFAEQLFGPDHWPQLRLVVAIVRRAEKKMKSRDAMRHTVETSPYYPAWVRDAEQEIDRAVSLLRERDLDGLGALAERNAWRMHATSLAANPPVVYVAPKTLELLGRLEAAREEGLRAWFTLDAGPNPVILCEAAQEDEVVALARSCGAEEVVRCHPASDARLSDQHLF